MAKEKPAVDASVKEVEVLEVLAIVDPIAERKAAELENGFLNPFGECTSYVEFLAAVTAAEVTVTQYCEMHLTEDEIAFIENELSILK